MNYKEYESKLFRSTTMLVFVTSIISIIIAILNFVVPFLLSDYVNHYNGNTNTLRFIVILVCFYIVSYVAKMLLNKLYQDYAVKFKTREHMTLLGFMFQMKYDKLNEFEPTYLVERITVCANTLYDVYAESVSKVITAVLSILIALGIAFSVSKMVTFIFVVLLFVQIGGYKKINALLAERCIKLQETSANNFKNILSVTSNVDYIKQLGAHNGILNILRPYVKGIHKENANVNKFAKDISTTVGTLISILQNIVYIVSAIYLVLNKITSAEFVLLSMISGLYLSSLNDIVNVNINLRDMKGVKKFIQEDLMSNMEDNGGNKLELIETIQYDIHNFGYDSEHILISQGTFMAKRGDVINISGDSGTGKTSLMKGMLKFLSIKDIYINGEKLTEINTAYLRHAIQFFSQNIPIISGTIKDNILMGEQEDDHALKSLKKKNFLRKFYELPEGLNTVILENGSNLSGGDKQKIALARLYLDSPQVIILDESTNSIDEAGSYEIIQNIIEEFHDKIIFIISHDSKVKQYCNKIVEIKDQKLVCKTVN